MSRRAVLVLWLGLLGVGLWLALTRTPVTTDMTAFMPRAQNPTEQLLLDELREGPAARLLLVALEGAPGQTLAQVSRRLRETLQDSALFLRISNGEDRLDPELRRRLWRYRYLLSPQVREARFSAQGLGEALQQRLRELASPLAPFDKGLLPADPSGELPALLGLWRGLREPAQRHGVWFSPDGKRALLIAETRAAGLDLDGQQKALEALHRSFEASVADSNATLAVTGPGVFASLSQTAIRTETQSLSIAASLMVALLLWLAYRSPRPLLLGVLPLASGILAAVAVVGLVFGGLHGITLAFGVTLLGVALDYPIHLFSHLVPGTPVAAQLAGLWPTLRLGVVTTVIGYLAMVGMDFPGLAQLGVFAAVGLLGAAAVTRWVLPILLPAHWGARPPLPGGLERWRVRRQAWLRGIAAGLGLGLLAWLLIAQPLVWEQELAALSPVPAAARRLDRELRSQLHAPEVSQLLVVTAADAQQALVRSEALAPLLQDLTARQVIGGFDLAARYLPSAQTQRQRQAQLPAPQILRENLASAVRGLPFRAGLFEPFLADVEAARKLPPLTVEDLSADLPGLKVGSLLFQRQGRWVALIPLFQIQDRQTLVAALAGREAVHYLDLKAASDRLLAGFRHHALERLGWGTLAISAVLMVGLRRPGRVLAALLPVALAMAVTLAALALLGERLTLFHLVALLLVLGIGIDYSLFFGRPDPGERVRTLHALLVCAASTVTVFGMLALSAIPVLKAIGLTAALGGAATLVMAAALARPPMAKG